MKDPKRIMCVCKANGVEVGRIRPTAGNAVQFVEDLARKHNGLQVEYEDCEPEDEQVTSIVRGLFRR